MTIFFTTIIRRIVYRDYPQYSMHVMNDSNSTSSPLPSPLQNGRIQTMHEKSLTVTVSRYILISFPGEKILYLFYC